MRSVKLVWLLALAAVGCSSSQVVGPESINGKWAEDFSIAGSAMQMDLTAVGSSISGTGDWRGEAGPSGSLTVTGTISEGAVHLDLSFTRNLPQPDVTLIKHFDGRLTAPAALQGSINTEPPMFPAGHISFHKI